MTTLPRRSTPLQREHTTGRRWSANPGWAQRGEPLLLGVLVLVGRVAGAGLGLLRGLARRVRRLTGRITSGLGPVLGHRPALALGVSLVRGRLLRLRCAEH